MQIGTFAFNFNILVPVFAKDVLNQQASGYGFLMSSMGMGSLIGAIIISFISKSGPKKIILSLFPVIISLAFIITGFTSNYYVSAAFIGICGFLCVVFTTTANSTTQINTNPEFHGRIMSVYSLLMAGTTPIGNFYCGVLMKYIGPRSGFIGCGLAIGLLILGLYLFRSFNTSFRHN